MFTRLFSRLLVAIEDGEEGISSSSDDERSPTSRNNNLLANDDYFEENVEVSRRLQQQQLSGILLGKSDYISPFHVLYNHVDVTYQADLLDLPHLLLCVQHS